MSFTREDAAALMNRAIATEGGIKLRVSSHAEAVRMRHQCYKTRKQEFDRSMMGKTRGEPGFGETPWDKIIIYIEDGDEVWMTLNTQKPDLTELLDEAVDLITGEKL